MTTTPHLDTPRTRWTSGTTVPGGGWVYVTPGARELFTGTALVPGWRRIVSKGPDQDGDFALYGIGNTDAYQFVRGTDCDVRAEDGARLTVGDIVTVDAPGEKYHGMTGMLAEDDGTDLPYWVRFETGGAEWFTPSQVSPVSDGDTFPGEADTTAPTTVTITTQVTIPRQATAEQVADALAHVDGHHEVTVHTYADRIEIHAHHKETRG